MEVWGGGGGTSSLLNSSCLQLQGFPQSSGCWVGKYSWPIFLMRWPRLLCFPGQPEKGNLLLLQTLHEDSWPLLTASLTQCPGCLYCTVPLCFLVQEQGTLMLTPGPSHLFCHWPEMFVQAPAQTSTIRLPGLGSRVSAFLPFPVDSQRKPYKILASHHLPAPGIGHSLIADADLRGNPIWNCTPVHSTSTTWCLTTSDIGNDLG